MNVQPYHLPPKFWAPRLHPWWFQFARILRNRDLKKQRIRQVELRGLDYLQEAFDQDAGVLLTPNHSFHYDSYCLMRAADQLRRPFHIMAAWQVFGMTGPLGRWTLQRSGCFSVNREGTDRVAFRTAAEILQQGRNPLVIFPEGDIYHTNDRVMPFRDGAAAVALTAAKRSTRPIVCIPVALKAWYATDPTRELEATTSVLEGQLGLPPCEPMPLRDRIYRLAEGALARKECEHFGQVQAGTVGERMRALSSLLLEKQERKHVRGQPAAEVPERVQELRRLIIPRLGSPTLTPEDRRDIEQDLAELFFVMQLYSYPGNYLSALPTTERLAETLDKLEEDVLERPYPSVRGERHVVVQFGEPIRVTCDRAKKRSAAELTDLLEQRVQALLDQLNGQRPGRFPAPTVARAARPSPASRESRFSRRSYRP
jgi:1-acyl-sn-glycerol-3-phosphate acyltransferase